MHIKSRILYVALCFLFLFATVDAAITMEQKNQKNTHTLCGGDFIDVFKLLCNNRIAAGRRRKRLFTEFSSRDLKEENILERRDAMRFLDVDTTKIVKRGLGMNVRDDNANEECCYETCSYSEVSGYCSH